MALPRLPESTETYDLNIVIGTKLRPYFEIWYQKMKLDGESPRKFAKRILKNAAMNDYVQNNLAAEHQAISDDVKAMETEVD